MHFSQENDDGLFTGLQFRKSEQNGFHDNFLIFQSNPMMWPSLKSSLRDYSNEWSHHMVWLRNEKVRILKTLNFRPYMLPCCWIESQINMQWLWLIVCVAWRKRQYRGFYVYSSKVQTSCTPTCKSCKIRTKFVPWKLWLWASTVYNVYLIAM